MPQPRRQRKVTSSVADSPPAPRTGVLPDLPVVTPPVSPCKSRPKDSGADHPADADTSENPQSTDNQLPLDASIPVNDSTQAAHNTLDDDVVVAVISEPDGDGVRHISPLKGGAVIKVKKDSSDSSQNVFEKPAKESSAPPTPGSLGYVMEETIKGAAEMAAIGSPLVSILTPVGRTGIPVLDCALVDIRASRFCVWMANSHFIFTNCTWRTGDRSFSSMLQWKETAPDRPANSDDDVILGMIGTISPDGLNFSPDGNWQSTWSQDGLHKQKRTGYLECPSRESEIPQQFWDAQLGGASKVIKAACPSPKEGSWNLGHCFFNKEKGNFRFRSPIFLPGQAGAGDEDEDEDEDEDRDDESTASSIPAVPTTHSYATWKFGSPDVRNAFDRVVEKGFEPQVLPVYSGSSRLIHPNNVTTTLSGAIVIMYFTLERLRLSKKQQRSAEVHFYANIVNIQLLKPPPPGKHTGKKRKFTHKFSMILGPGSGGRLPDGSPPQKKARLAEDTE